MNLKNRSIFAVLSFSILALIMTAYSSTVQSVFITTFAQDETGNLNEAEVNADIKEQENKCKKDTECENENEINNKLNIVSNGTQSQGQETTLNVIKNLTCTRSGQTEIPCPEGVGPEDFTITVEGNNPSPSQFPGSEQGTLVTLGAGGYSVSENRSGELEQYEWSASFSGDCIQNDDFAADGTIAEGQSQTCTIANELITVGGSG